MKKYKDKIRLSADCSSCTFYEEGYCSYFERYQTERNFHDTCEHFYPNEFANEFLRYEENEDE